MNRTLKSPLDTIESVIVFFECLNLMTLSLRMGLYANVAFATKDSILFFKLMTLGQGQEFVVMQDV